MIAAVTEDTIATGNETVSSSPGVSIQERTVDVNECDQKQQQAFCETNKSNFKVETRSRTFTDVEDTFQKQTNGIPHIDDSKKGNSNSSYLYLFFTAYVPLIVLWFRRSMLGPANLIRTIIVGQLMRLVFVDNITEWMSERLPPWLEVILFQYATIKGSSTGTVSTILGTGGGKVDPHAWPPPAFTALALLTIFALVVHPDGLTWILLGKLRDAIYAVFSSLGQCLEFLLNDYGIFPTIIAATTLAAMFFVVFVVLRTLSPKKANNLSDKHNNTLHNERKKKKKKGGNARHRNNHHRSNKIKLSSRSQSQIGDEVEPVSRTASPRSPMPSLPPSEVTENTLSSPSIPSKDTAEGSLQVPSFPAPSSSITTNIESIEPASITTNIESTEPVEQAASDKTPISNGVSKPKENKTRRRMMSGSTSDTTPLSDDQSCGSTSVRSFPSVSVNSNRSGGGNMNKKNNKGSSSTPRRMKRHGGVKSPKNAERNSGKKNKFNTADPSATSRWDALKPETGHVGKNSNNAYSHHHANGNTSNKKQNQQQHPRHHRGNSRRGHGTSGNGPSRKGRQHQKSVVTSEESTVDRNRVMTVPVSSSGPALRANNNVRSSINDVSPIAPTQQDNDCVNWSKNSTGNPFSNPCTTSPQSNSMLPPPPPGFQTVSNVPEFEKKNADLHCRQDHVNNDFLATSLFETPASIRSVVSERASKTTPSPRNDASIISPDFFPSSRGTVIQENPFTSNNNIVSHQANLDSQIEADLQELGGQMAGSILDF